MSLQDHIFTRTRPARWWIAVTVLAGAAGALAAVGLFSKSEYTIPPFRVELSAVPSLSGDTELSVRPLPGLEPGFAEASTHRSPITFRMTVLGVESAAEAARLVADPHTLAEHLRFSEQGRDAVRDFGIRLGLIALAGGAAGGVAVSFGRWRRIVGGVLAGALVVGVVAVLLHQTYEVDEFRNARFRPAAARSAPSGG